MTKSWNILGSLLLAFALPALAQEPSALPMPEFKQDGNRFLIQWSPDRVAEIKMSANMGLPLRPTLTLIESTCTERAFSKLPVCTLVEEYNDFDGKLIWINHEDPSRLGQEVRMKNGSDSSFNLLAGSFNKSDKPSVTQNLNEVSFSCDDWSWLPGSTYKDFHIIDWSTQNMEENPHTGVSENKASTSSQSVKSVSREDSKNTKTLLKKDAMSSFAAAFIAGDEIGWTLKDQNQICEIAWKPSDVQSLAQDLFSVEKKPMTDEKNLFAVLKALAKERSSFYSSSTGLEFEKSLLVGLNLISASFSIDSSGKSEVSFTPQEVE